MKAGGVSKVFALIPEDGTPIRFKDIHKKCSALGITYRILRQELIHLQEAGTIIKEKAKSRRGAGTQYRRNVSLHVPELPGYNRIFSNLITRMKALVDKTDTEEEKGAIASRGLLSVLWTLNLTIWDELQIYTTTPDKEQAERRLDSVLSDFISPMIKRTAELASLPGACDMRAALAMDQLFVDNMARWLDVRRSVKVSEGKLSIEEAKQKIAEIKKKAGIKD